MIEEFKNLREDELEVLFKAPVLVAVLIAGADSKIDDDELEQAVDVAESKQSRAREHLLEYYKEVGNDFKEKLNKAIAELPSGVEERNDAISKELRKLNHILPKIDQAFAIKLHASLKDMAKKIAEASGGLLGYMSVSYEEAKLMDLPMLKDPANN